jgi:hypothetical protein
MPSPRASGAPRFRYLSDVPRCIHYRPSNLSVVGLIPSGTWWRPHHKLGWCGLARLYPTRYKYNGSSKNRGVCVGFLTSLQLGTNLEQVQ